MKILKNFVYILIIIFLLPFYYAFGKQLCHYFYTIMNYESWINLFLIGFSAYLTLYFVVLKKIIGFIETFEHELGHTIAAFLMFQRVFSFNASDKGGGKITHSSPNFVITLAPYFLPVFTLPFLIVKPWIVLSAEPYFDFFIGFTLAFHFVSLFKEFRPSQTDLQCYGMIISTAIIILFNMIFITISIAAVAQSYNSLWIFFKNLITISMPAHYLITYKKLSCLF